MLLNGNLLDVFTNPSSDLGVVEFVASTDHGAAWSANPTVIASLDFGFVSDPNQDAYIRTGHID